MTYKFKVGDAVRADWWSEELTRAVSGYIIYREIAGRDEQYYGVRWRGLTSEHGVGRWSEHDLELVQDPNDILKEML